MTVSARLAVLPPGQRQLELHAVVLPEPGLFEVVVEQRAAGICHSQLHQVNAVRSQPLVLGHESTGRVAAVGSEVEYVEVGDDVLVTWLPRRRRYLSPTASGPSPTTSTPGAPIRSSTSSSSSGRRRERLAMSARS